MPARRFSTALIALIATIGMCAVAIPAEAMPLSASCARPSTASGNLRGIVRPTPSPTRSTCHLFASFADPTVADGGDPPLLKHAGVVMGAAGTGTVTVTPIWWLPTGYSVSSGYRDLVEQFISDVAADSGTATNVFSPMTEYTSAAGEHIRYDLTAATSVTDTTAFPTHCTPDSGAGYSDGVAYSACVSNADLGAEVTALLARKGLSSGTSHLYVVLLPKKAELCGDSRNAAKGGDCSVSPSGGSFCAFHSWTSAPAIYAAMPYEEANGCRTGEAPNGVADGDAVVSPLSHEMNEAITDPTGDGWYDSANFENGDECAWIFGATSGPAGGLYNQTIDGHHYLLQLEFSNESFNAGGDACVAQRPLPTPYFAQPAPSLPGRSIPFDATGSRTRTVAPIATYAWSFGDGGTATGATPSHTYATAGSYEVTITVTDADGWTAGGSRTVVAGFAPGAPAASAAAASSSSATLKWSPPANPGTTPITGYTIGRDGTDTSGHGAWSRTVPASARSYTLVSLVAGRSYHLTVRAISAAGAGATTTVTTPISSAMTAPAATTVVQTGTSSARISWTPPSAAGGRPITGYTVSRNGVDTNGTGAWSKTLAASARSFTMLRLVRGSTYTLSVQAVTASGTAPSASGQVRVQPYLTAPRTVAAAQRSAATATITWAAPTTLSGQTIVGYLVSRDGTDAAGGGPSLTKVAAAATSFTMTRLAVGTPYTLSVQALTAGAVSVPVAKKVTITS